MSIRTMADRGTVEAASIPPSAAADPHGLPESRPQLGSLLLRDGVITAEQLQAALAQKEAEGGRLGEILLGYNIATGAKRSRGPRGAVRLEYVELSRFEVVPPQRACCPRTLRGGSRPFRSASTRTRR